MWWTRSSNRREKAYKEPYKPRASDWLQHAGEDLESEVFLVTDSVGSTLDDTDLVVESLDEAELHLVLGEAVCRDAVPVAFAGEGQGFDIDAVTESDLAMPARAPSSVTMEDLDRVNMGGSADLMPPGTDVQPMGRREYGLSRHRE